MIKAIVFVLALICLCTASPSVCTRQQLASSYDVIVVGTGLGGCVAARRLAESNPNWKILLIERGIAYNQCPGCSFASNATSYIGDPASGPFVASVPQPALNNNPIYFKDTAVQGGGTSVNGMFHIRGDVNRFFSQHWPITWNPLSMFPYYEQYENYSFPSVFHTSPWAYSSFLRSKSGMVRATQQGTSTPFKKFVDAVKAVFPNIPAFYNTSLNDGLHPGVGVSYPESTSVGPNRVSAYTSYIQSYNGTNLKVITGVLVSRILFVNSTVSGIQVQASTDVNSSACNLFSSRVVLSAGALGTPKLLKLSGVGNAGELAAFGIPSVSNLSGVGENMRDHITVFAIMSAKNGTTIPYDNNGINNYGWTYFNAADQLNVPNDFIYNFQTLSPGLQGVSVAGTNLLSAGSVKLASLDARVPALVDPNYFGVSADRNAVALAVMKSFNVSALMGLQQANDQYVQDPCAGVACDTPEQVLQAYINGNRIYPGYHFTSTAALCNVTNPLTLRVKGTSGLYVLDASIMPFSPPANTQSTLYAVSERGIDLINSNMHASPRLQGLMESIGMSMCS